VSPGKIAPAQSNDQVQRIAAAAWKELDDPSRQWHWRRPDPLGALCARFPLRLLTRDQVGLDVGSSWVKYSVVRHGLGAPRLLAAGGVPIAPNTRGQIARMRSQVAALLTVREKIVRRHERWVVGIGGAGTMVRTVEVPRMPRGELNAAILWQAQKKFPFALDDANLAITLLRTGPKLPVKAVVSAALKRTVDDFLYLLSEAEIHPDVLTLPAFSLSAALRSERTVESGDYQGVINVGAEQSYLAVYRGLELEFYRELDIGINDLVEILLADPAVRGQLGALSQDRITTLLFERGVKADQDTATAGDPLGRGISSALDRLVIEIQSTLEYYAGQAGGLRVGRFSLLGGGAGMPGICGYLARALEIPVQLLAPKPWLAATDADAATEIPPPARWVNAYGLALLPRKAPNVLPREHLEERREQFRTTLWRTAGASAVAISLVAAGTEMYLAHQSATRLTTATHQLAEVTRRIEQIGAREIETTLQANRNWMSEVRRPDLNTARVMRTIAAVTPEAIVLDRLSIHRVDSTMSAAVGLYGEVRTEHSQNEVVLADYIQRLKTTGIFTDVELTGYTTRRNPDFEQIVFSASMKTPLEVTR